jgi:Carboxypeptidase regulatory-like domain
MAWVPLDLPAPEAVAGAGFAAFPGQGMGVLFGGRTATGLSNVTAIYNETLDAWTVLTPLLAPSARSDFGFSDDPAAQAAVLFGGEVNATSLEVSNATWLYSFTTRDWTNVSGAVAPAPRQDPAFTVGSGIALLYGGWAQNVSGTGELTYSDTWLLNLSTDAWTRVPASGGPSPGAIHGASLVWQPALNEFLLFGGCYPCSAEIWSFSPITHDWAPLSVTGYPPPPRMNAVWSWDPTQGVDLLFGGTNGTADLDDTYLFQPVTGAWTRATTSTAPSARSAAAGDFLDPAGNQTLLLSGGSGPSGPLSDTWRLAAVSNLSIQVTNASSGVGIANATVLVNHGGPLLTNATGYVVDRSIPSNETLVNASQAGFAPASRTLWIAPGTNVAVVLALAPLAPANLDLTVAEPNGTPVAGVAVELVYQGRLLAGSPHFTNTSGFTSFSDVPSANYTLSASKEGFRSAIVTIDLPPGETTSTTLTLNPLFVLTVLTQGRLPNGNVTPLQEVAVVVGGVPRGTTGALGTLVITVNETGNTTVTASVFGYHNASGVVDVTTTGSAQLNLTLQALAYPVITIEVLGQRGTGPGFPVRGAYVNATSTTTLPTGKFYGNYTTNVEGTVTFAPPPGNYSVRVAAIGFLPNESVPVIEALPGNQIGRTVYLSLIGFTNVAVLVLSTVSGNPPIGRADVHLNFTAVNLSTGLPYPSESRTSLSTGWANFSGVPQSKALWSASAPGYLPNNGSYVVVVSTFPNEFTIYLTPVPPATYVGLKIFPTTPADAWPLAVLPVACLVGALVYLTMLRNPASREREIREAARRNLRPTERPGNP